MPRISKPHDDAWTSCAARLTMLFALAAATPAKADWPAFLHIVRPGETLASIAHRYYGDPRRESVLVAENGLTAQGGAAIVVGLRLVVPWVTYHRARPTETWGHIATQHYGDPRRAGALIAANPQVQGAQPDEGAELLIPYPLRHVAQQGETMQRLAELYFGDAREVARLLRFNGTRRRRLNRGQIVLVPLADLLLSDAGRRLIEEATGHPPPVGEMRSLQMDINRQLPVLRDHLRHGRYTEALALGNQMLGKGGLTGNQLVTIQRELAVALVALGRPDLARDAFFAALARQPDLQLDSRLTSPVVMSVFQEARGQAKPTADASVADPAAPERRAQDRGAPDPGAQDRKAGNQPERRREKRGRR